jgi:hypothetical protein
MITAQKKRKENMAEYLLYMFQIEDIIRAFNLNLQKIENQVIKPLNLPESSQIEMVDWYSNLILMMEKEKNQTTGHFRFINNLISDLHDFHLRLLEYEADEDYTRTYKSTAGLINEFRRKTVGELNDIEICLNALYGYFILKISNKSISEETQLAINSFSIWLNKLSTLFLRFESGNFEL